MTNVSDKRIERRIKRLEERIYGDLQFPEEFEYPDGIGGGGGLEEHDNTYHSQTYATETYVDNNAGGATNRTLNIPTTNLADTEEIRQFFVAPAGVTSAVVRSTLLNEAGQAPNGLDIVVYDFDASAEVYRNGATYNEPADLTLTAGNTHYVSIENGSGAEQNANAVLDMEIE